MKIKCKYLTSKQEGKYPHCRYADGFCRRMDEGLLYCPKNNYELEPIRRLKEDSCPYAKKKGSTDKCIFFPKVCTFYRSPANVKKPCPLLQREMIMNSDRDKRIEESWKDVDELVELSKLENTDLRKIKVVNQRKRWEIERREDETENWNHKQTRRHTNHRVPERADL